MTAKPTITWNDVGRAGGVLVGLWQDPRPFVACAELVAIVKERLGSDQWATVLVALSWGVTSATLEPHMRSAAELRALFAEQLDCPVPLFAATLLQSVLAVPRGGTAAAADAASGSASTGASSSVRLGGGVSILAAGGEAILAAATAPASLRPRRTLQLLVPPPSPAAAASAATPDRDELLVKLSKEFTVPRLKEELRKLGLSMVGKKSALVERLADAQMKNCSSIVAPTAARTGGGDLDAAIVIAVQNKYGERVHCRINRSTCGRYSRRTPRPEARCGCASFFHRR